MWPPHPNDVSQWRARVACIRGLSSMLPVVANFSVVYMLPVSTKRCWLQVSGNVICFRYSTLGRGLLEYSGHGSSRGVDGLAQRGQPILSFLVF
jgi:hypothetical protein